MARQSLNDNPFQPDGKDASDLPRRDLLRLAAVAVVFGVASSPVRALGSTLRLNAPHPYAVLNGRTVVITYPSGTMASSSYTQTSPDEATGTWRQKVTNTITWENTISSDGSVTSTVYTFTQTGVDYVTQSGTLQTVTNPSYTFPSGTATATVTVGEGLGGSGGGMAAGGRRATLPNLRTWNEQIRSRPSLA